MRKPSPKLMPVIALAATLGCSHPALFEASQAAEDLEFRDDLPVVIDYEVRGGFAGIHRHLTVFSNHLVRFTDDPRAPQRSFRDRLEDSEYENLISTFATANFFGLQERYIDPNVADAFHYDIVFNQSGTTKKVEAEGIRLPKQLQDVISALDGTIQALVQNGVKLQLSLSDSTIAAGESVTFTLTATAPSTGGRTLTFPTAQTYDFFVVSDSPLPPGDPIPQDKIVWKWSAGRVFAQVVRTVELRPGESRTYTETWTARDAGGNPLKGRFWVIGSLKSVPGGDSAAVELTIE